MELILMLLNFALLVVVLIICILVILYAWFSGSKTAKRYSGFPTYGASNPLSVFWQYYQQVRNFRQFPLPAHFFKLVTANAYLFQSEGIFKLFLGLTPYICVYKTEYVKTILSSRIADDKSDDYALFVSVFGNSLFNSNGKRWRDRKRILQPAFHSKAVKMHIPIYNEHSYILVDKLKEKTNEPWIDAQHVLGACSLDIMFHTTTGNSAGVQDGTTDVALLESLNEVPELLIHRLIRPWLWYNPIYKLTSSGRKFRKYMDGLHSFVEKIILRRRDSLKIKQDNVEHQLSENDKNTCLDILLEHHFKDASLTLEDIQGQMHSILFAGYDTTATTMSWALCLLGLYPEVQDKVFQELYFIFGSNKTIEVTPDDLNNMIYLEQVLKETLRLYPAAPIIGRENKESIQIGTHIVPPKSHIAILIHMLHKNPDVFPNPEKFDPDRFSEENMTARDTYSFIPFSLGPRICIGNLHAMIQMKIVLCHIIRNFKIVALDSLDKMNVMMTATLSCLNPIRLKITLRE